MIIELSVTNKAMPLNFNSPSIGENIDRRLLQSSFQDLLGDVPPLRTAVDIAFVLDAAQSERYKENVQLKIDDYWSEFMDIYRYGHKTLHSLRISIVWFNDGREMSDYRYQRLGFTPFPDEKDKMLDYFANLNDLRIKGQRTAMNAVYEAAESDWNQDGDRIRHIIVLMTDHEDSAKKERLHKDKMPIHEEFFMYWHYHPLLGENRDVGYNRRFKLLDPYGQRMLIFSPLIYPYNEMEVECENLIRCDVEQGKRCEDIKSETIFQLIAACI